MAEEQTVDNSGVTRTETGAIADQSPEAQSQTTTQETTQETSQQTEAKPAADGKTLLTEGKNEEPKVEEKKDEKTGAPDKYSDYKVPDGYTLDPEIKGEADKLFKGLGLSQEQAQSLVDFYTNKTTEAFQAPFKAYQEMTDGWRKEAEAHPDLRGKLGEGKEVNVRIAKMFEGIGDPALVTQFKETMDLTGVGNHPSFIRLLDKVAQRLTEGTHVAGKGPTTASQSSPDAAPPTVGGALWPKLPSAMDRR